MTPDRSAPGLPLDEGGGPAWVRSISVASWSFVGFVLAVGLVVVGLGLVRELIIPVVLGGFLAIVFSPAVDWLAKRRVPRGLAALLILVLVLLVAAGSIGVVVVGLVDQSDNLEQRLAEVVVRVEELLERSDLTGFVETILAGAEGSGSFLRDGLGSTVGSAIGTASGFFSGMVLGAVVLYYLLKDGPMLIEGLVNRDSGPNDRVARILADAAASVRSYIKGRTILALVQGVAIGLISAIAGVPLAFAIVVVNVIGAYVPYIGGFVGGAFAVLMALSVGGPVLAAVMLVAAVAISVGLENLLEPALLGNKLELHPIVILFATVTGGLLVGIVGMFLAAPAVAIGRSLFKELAASGFFHPQGSTGIEQRPESP